MKDAQKYINGLSYNRTAGILMPIFSLPSKYGIGDLGTSAHKFVDLLVSNKIGNKEVFVLEENIKEEF